MIKNSVLITGGAIAAFILCMVMASHQLFIGNVIKAAFLLIIGMATDMALITIAVAQLLKTIEEVDE